jgi:membrane associated rhomboid family serine protease
MNPGPHSRSRLQMVTWALRVCLLTSVSGALLFGVVAGAIDAVTYRPDPNCILFCSRAAEASFLAAAGAFGGAIAGLVVGFVWVMWSLLRRRTRRMPDSSSSR